MTMMQFVSYPATLDMDATGSRLDHLLVKGPLLSADMECRISVLSRDFRCYASTFPHPLWAPHLVITPEMRSLTEALLPLKEVAASFRHLLGRACLFRPLLETTALYRCASWVDVLQTLYPTVGQANPARVLASLAADDAARRDFLFSLFLPQRYGASFERYPKQAQWLCGWLESSSRRKRPIRALDSACGSGEGTYRLAELIVQHAATPADCVVHGSTFEHVELFAGAHGYFPHDPQRQKRFRERVAPLLQKDAPAMAFHLEDVTAIGEGGYDIVLVNGLLGGPMLSERSQVALAVARLAARLAPGGVLLAADRFHEGWKNKLPDDELKRILQENGLRVVQIEEGICGEKL